MRPGSCLRNIRCFLPPSGGSLRAILSMNREISRGLRSPGLETTLSLGRLFSNFRVLKKSGDGYRC